MAKKVSMVTLLLSLVVVAALVYFFRPQTFSFLKQGFADEDYEDDKEGFVDEDYADEDFADEDFEVEHFTAAKKGASGGT